MDPGPGHGGLIDQWRQGTLAIRALAHLASAVEASRGVPPRRRALALGASLAGDVAVGSRAGRPNRSRDLEAVVNTVDAIAWGLLTGPDPTAIRTVVLATVVPTAIETGFRLGAGTTAVPVVQPALPWRPAWDPPAPRLLSLRWSASFTGRGPAAQLRDHAAGRWPQPVPARLVELGLQVGRDLGPPLLGLGVARRLTGRKAGFGPVGWAGLAAAGGYALARSRDDAQRSTTELWDRRTVSVVDAARVGSRVQAALVHNIAAVDPKSILRLLAAMGSAPAATALAELQAQPVDTLRRYQTRGTTLANAAEQRPIMPEEDRTRWVADEQVAVLRRAIDATDADLAAAGLDEQDVDDTLHVLETWGARMVIAYRGRRIELDRATPELTVRLELTLPGLIVGTIGSGLTVLPALGGAPPVAVAAAVALQCLAGWRLLTRPAVLRRADRPAALLVAAAALSIDVAVGLRSRSPSVFGTSAPCPGTGATQPLVLLLALNWWDLPRERWPLTLAAVAGWTVALRGSGPRSVGNLLHEVVFLLIPAIAAATTGADTKREADALDDLLDRRLVEGIETAARDVARAELKTFRSTLEVVVDELQRHPGLDQDLAERVLRDYRAELARLDGTDPLAIINW